MNFECAFLIASSVLLARTQLLHRLMNRPGVFGVRCASEIRSRSRRRCARTLREISMIPRWRYRETTTATALIVIGDNNRVSLERDYSMGPNREEIAFQPGKVSPRFVLDFLDECTSLTVVSTSLRATLFTLYFRMKVQFFVYQSLRASFIALTRDRTVAITEKRQR